MATRPPASPLEARRRLAWVCPGCATLAPWRARSCPRCHERFPTAWPAPAAPGPRSRGLLLVAATVAAIALAFASTTPSTPRLAALQVGDPGVRVRQHLGRPARAPHEILWHASDGTPHRAVIWEYALLMEGDEVVPRVSVTLLDGRVFQIGVLDARYATDRGLRVGDPLAKARRLYGTAIEEAPVAGLVPLKFLHGGVVIKVVVAPDGDRVLALGLESPRNLPMPAAEPEAPGLPDAPRIPL